MVIKILITAFLCMVPMQVLLAMGNGLADEDCEEDYMPSLLPLELPEISEIIITSPSYDLGKEDPTFASKDNYLDCSQFSITLLDVKDYFSLASKISEQDYMHTIDWVPCRAKGHVFFKDGNYAEWDLMWSSAGTLRFPDGRTEYLYCDKCPDPFVQ